MGTYLAERADKGQDYEMPTRLEMDFLGNYKQACSLAFKGD